MGPDFLCIGAQKAGTTWLDHNLRGHPALWLPPLKELHYFERPHCVPLRDLLVGKPYQRWLILGHLKTAALTLRHQPRQFGWYVRFFLGARGDAWYTSLFQPNPGQLAGEVTPDYACMAPAKIGHMHALLPQAKLIYLLRNPIDRLLSHMAMTLRRSNGGRFASTDDASVRRFLERRNPHRHSDYLTHLATWERYYAPEHLFIGFFDQLQENPAQLLGEILAFLEVDSSDRYIPASVTKRIYSHSSPSLPQHLVQGVAQRYLGQIEALHDRFQNPYTARWLADTRAMLV